MISAAVHHYSPLYTNIQHQTDILQMAGPLETPATCSNTQQDSSWVDCASWLSLIPFRLEANYILLMTSHFIWLSSSSLIPKQQIMAPQGPDRGASGTKLRWLMGASANVPPTGTQQKRRHQFVHRYAANVARETISQDAHLKNVRITGHSKNKEQHAILGCE